MVEVLGYWCLYTAIRLAIGFFFLDLYLLCLSTIVYNRVMDPAVFEQLYASCRYSDPSSRKTIIKRTSSVKFAIIYLA